MTLVSLGNTAFNVERPIDMIRDGPDKSEGENNYVRVNCGIMDQFASAMGRRIMPYSSTAEIGYKHVPLNLKGYSIVITNTNKKRGLADSKYNERRASEAAFEILNKFLPEATCLGEISMDDFNKHKHKIKDETIRKRG